MTLRGFLKMTHLESRFAPAVATWDGGGTNANWTTAANWAGDVAPNPGDDLVFPNSASQFTNVNDFAAGTAFGHLQIDSNAYHLTGNALHLSGGIVADFTGGTLSTPAVIDFAITLDADQTFARVEFFGSMTLIFNGTIDLAGHALSLTTHSGDFLTLPTLQFNSPVVGNGSITASGSGGFIAFDAVNTFTGAVTVSGQAQALFPIIQVNGQIGQVVLQSGTLNGSGMTGNVSVNGGTIYPAVGNSGTPTLGNLDLASGNLFINLNSAGTARVNVHGMIHLSGGLFAGLDTGFHVHRGDVFVIVNNDGTDPVVGTFNGLPEGALTDSGLRITYHGGDGNDVALMAVQLPVSVVGAGAGGFPIVNVYDADGLLFRSFYAYNSAFRGGVRVALGDVNGDGFRDVITAPGPGGGPHIRVFDGVTGAVIREFLAYDSAFTGGVFIAATDLDRDRKAEIITGAGAGGGPHVKAFSGATGAVLSSFMAYDQSFRGGVSVSGIESYIFVHTSFIIFPSQIVTGAGPGGAPHVRVFDALSGHLKSEFMAFDARLRGGVNVAATLVRGFNSFPIIAAAQATGGPPTVRVCSTDGSLLSSFLAYDAGFTGGVTLAFEDFTAKLLTGTGRGGQPLVLQWRESDYVQERSVYAFDPAFLGGVYVG